jgi:putative hemolysin
MKTWTLGLLAPLLVAAACAAPRPLPPAIPAMVGMPNPASVHCIREGGDLQIRRQADGGEYGVCVFDDGRQCEEWVLFRDGRCVAPTARSGTNYE